MPATLNNYYRDVAKEAGFKILGLRCKRASYRRILPVLFISERIKEYTDLKLILRAYLISPKKNERIPVNITARINRITGYFEENDGGIYKPPFRGNLNNNEDDKKEPPRVKQLSGRVARLVKED
ncbi:hypothetical protein QBC39DRAFT_334471 [Podospora conica]|nr:hypothetical protein QBC39DRAFT_334471 [Schizothecium conicum]